jgi:transcriptional regulator with PAS, ATPase and Fis domain
VALVLAHLPAGADPEVLTPLLHAAAAGPRRSLALVLAERCCDEHARALLAAGAAAYLALPGDLAAFTRLAGVFTGPAPRAQPADDGGDDDDLPELMAPLRRLALQDTTLLLSGETGTGKTRLARLIHELSPLRHQPLLVIDCGALSASLIESELFGHAKGAFTGADRERAGKLAAAGRGTLLLDEVNSLPLPLQGKLLRAIDERVFEPVGSERPQPVLARLLAASNVPLEREVAEGRFRRDLYYRLSVVSFELPPLRARRGRIGPLAERFLAECAARHRRDVVGLSAPAVQVLEACDWPGNIRELRNAIERAVALCQGPVIGPDDLPPAVRSPQPWPAEAVPPTPNGLATPTTLSQSLQEAEMRRIREALMRHHNNRLRAAAELGISRMGLYKKLHKYGLIDKV